MAWVLAGTTLGLLALLAVPVDVALEANRRERFASRVRVRWLFGLVSLPTPAGRGKPGRERKVRKKKKRKPGRRARGARRALAVMESPGFARRVVRLGRDLLARVRPRRMALTLRFGADNPADTGRLWGVVGPATALLPVPAGADVTIAPEFAEAAFELDGAFEARIVPAAVLFTLFAFLLAPATLRAAFAAVRA